MQSKSQSNEIQSKLIKRLMATIISIILIGVILIPVVSGMQDSFYETEEYTNVEKESAIFMSAVNSTTSNTLNVDSSGITVGSGVIPYWSESADFNVVLLTNTIGVVVNGSGAITISDSTGTTTGTSFTAIISAGEITYSVDSGDSVTIPYVSGYVAALQGDYVSCYQNTHKYFDSTNFAQFRYDSVFKAYVDGVSYSNGSVVSDYALHYTEVDGTDGQVKDLSAINYTSSRALNSVMVLEANAEYKHTDDQSVVTLLGIIPILTLIAVLISVINFVSNRRD